METLYVDMGSGSGRICRFRVLRRFGDRLRGLLGTDRSAEAVALVGCSSIHTFGMRYAIDVALVGEDGLVLKARRALPPGRVLASRGAWCALERPASPYPWMCEGDSLVPEAGASVA